MPNQRQSLRRVVKTSNARKVMFDGREHLVEDVVLLVEGVHAGSAGPIYYPPSTLQEIPEHWNGRALPIYHPEDTGFGFSANTPEVWEKRVVGWLFNVRYEAEPKPRVIGEVWLDRSRLKRISPETLTTVEAGRPLEVSTGVYFWTDGQPGTWNGEEHNGTALAYVGDHLALLPGEVGACSGADGCGINTCNRCTNAKKGSSMKKPLSFLSRLVQIAGGNEIEGQKLWDALQKSRTVNEMSLDDMREALYTAVSGAYDTAGWSHYVQEVFEDRVIFVASGSDAGNGAGFVTKMFQVGYSVSEDGTVELAGDPVEVEQVYQVKTAEESANAGSAKETAMNREKLIEALIASNASPFEASDLETLRKFSEPKVSSLCAKFGIDPKTGQAVRNEEKPKEEEEEETSANADEEKEEDEEKMENKGKGKNAAANGKRPTLEEWLQTAPPEVVETFRTAHARNADEKNFLVAEILRNPRNLFAEAALRAMDTDTLRTMRDMTRPVNYAGQGGGVARGSSEARETGNAGGVKPTKAWDLKGKRNAE